MRHRDTRLFYLAMEVRIRRADARTLLILDDSARPAMLQACHPTGESKFHLQMKSGGLIRVHTSALQPTSQYKSLLISEQTTSDELLGLLLSCYSLNEPVEEFSLYEVCPDQEYQRKLHPDDLPLKAQILRNQKGENCHFLVRRIRNLARRSLQLDATTTTTNTTTTHNDDNSNKSNYSLDIMVKSSPDVDMKPLELSPSMPNISDSIVMKSSTSSLVKSTFNKLESCLVKLNALRYDQQTQQQQVTVADVNGNTISLSNSNHQQQLPTPPMPPPRKCHCNSSQKCNHCRCSCNNKNSNTQKSSLNHTNNNSNNNLKGFNDSSSTKSTQKPQTVQTQQSSTLSLSTYSPVYNIREIRTVQNSFSSFGIDKKLIDLDVMSTTTMTTTTTTVGRAISRRHSVAVDELVNAHPTRGIGNYVYI